MHHIMTTSFLTGLIFLEPLNLFLYTWRFLAEIEHNTTNQFLKQFYKLFARISIILVPATFISVVTSYIVVSARALYYGLHFQEKDADYYAKIE